MALQHGIRALARYFLTPPFFLGIAKPTIGHIQDSEEITQKVSCYRLRRACHLVCRIPTGFCGRRPVPGPGLCKGSIKFIHSPQLNLSQSIDSEMTRNEILKDKKVTVLSIKYIINTVLESE